MKNTNCHKLCNHFFFGSVYLFKCLSVYPILFHLYVSHKVGDHSMFSFLVSDHREQIALAFLYIVGKESNFHILRFIIGVCFSI